MRAREREMVPPVMDLAAAEVDLAVAEGSDVGGCERGASYAGDERAQEGNRARAGRAEQGRARERRKFDGGATPAAEGVRWWDRAWPRRVRDGGATPSYGACNRKSTRGREPTGGGAPGKRNGKSARGSEVNPRP